LYSRWIARSNQIVVREESEMLHKDLRWATTSVSIALVVAALLFALMRVS
jgi:hypothetical protein